jgi:hypothetical protein
MSVLFGAGPDIDTQKRLQGEGESTIQGAQPNVGLVNFGQSALGSMDPAGRNAMLNSVAGYQDIINDPSGLGAAGRAAVLGGQNQAAQQSAATLRGLEEARQRSGASSAGDTMAQEAAAAGGQASAANQAGLQGATLGAEQKLAALGGNTAAGAQIGSQDITKAKGMDEFNLIAKEAQQKQMQQNFQNALNKAGAFNSNLSTYSGTKAGGGYGLLGNGLLSGQNIGAVAGAMTGGLGNLAGLAGGLLGGGGGGASATEMGPGGGSALNEGVYENDPFAGASYT